MRCIKEQIQIIQDKTVTENTSVIKYHKNYMFLIQVIQVRLIYLRVNH